MEKTDRFTREWFLHQKGDWVRTLSKIPEFDVGKLKHYLTESRNKTFDKEGMRAYKSLKAYKFFEEGYVQKISSLQMDNSFLAWAEVMASMAQRVYKPYVCLSLEGDVQGGSCDCVAGKGEACSHIAALLFALDDFVAKGLKDLPEDRSSTEKLCQWNKPAKRKTEPKTIHNIRIVKYGHLYEKGLKFVLPKQQEPGKVVKGRETLASLKFDPRPPVDQLQEEESKSRLTEALEGANPTCGFIKYNKPVADVPNVTESSLLTKEIVSTVKHFTDFELPPNILDLKNACMYFKDSLHLDGNEIVELESRTRGQSSSQEWHSARKYRLTASDFHKVFVRKSTTDPSKLLRYFLYNKMKPTNAMLFGLQQEKKAIEKFKSKLVEQGKHDVIVEQKGLVVDSHCTFLGASVDGIALINGEQFVLELKNPASTWDMDIPSAAKKLPCLKMNENNEVCLNVKHSYYTQIQGQMGILNISKCYFVFCTKINIHIEMVSFDEHFWERVLHKLTQFYDNFLLPEIVYPSVKFGLPAFDISKF